MTSALQRNEGFSPLNIDVWWQRFMGDYFLRHTHTQSARHCSHLLRVDDPNKPLVLNSKKAPRGGTEVFVYTKDQPACCATGVADVDRRNFNGHDTLIIASRVGRFIDPFIVLYLHG
ncbi:hypothetical protein UF29_00190 [Vibrio parahaemolyticus]|nr:hypothetical protein UF29_00190 [Vibrio parahaemolyticus]